MDLTMADNSTLMSDVGRSILADSSVLDCKFTETSKENLFAGSASDEAMPQIETRVVLVQEAGKSEKLLKALETIKTMEVPVIKIKETSPGKSEEKLVKSIIHMEIKVPYIKTDSVEGYGDSESPEFETVFVLADFEDPIFNYLYKADCRVLGLPIVLHCAQKGEALPFSCRPLYCATMLNLVLCFTGFRKKEQLVKLVTLAHHMGGVIRKDFSSKVTHLVANSAQGDKFRVAVSLGTPIMKSEWIYKAWERRNEIDFYATDEEFRNEFKVPPFQDCMLSFLGFSDEERANMEEMTEMQVFVCTYTSIQIWFNPPEVLPKFKLWFWGSIQMDARAGESIYLFEKPDSPEIKKSVSQLSLNTPNSNRKKRRLKETLAQLTRDTDMSPFPPRKRPSAEHSLSMGSLLDISNTPESNIETPKLCAKPSKNSTPLPPKQSARWQVAKELYQTESNYVDILTTVIQLFQVPLEKEGQLGGPILAPEEIKTIFGSIPDILDVHIKIKEDLEDLMINWSESKSIGDIILKYSKDLLKTYPPFVNFFEMSKETITRCEKQKPRFHAFLKINQAKPECGRQSLAELLIRPVQRLPSVALLLNGNFFYDLVNPDKTMIQIARKRHKVIGVFKSPHGQTRPPASLKHVVLMPLSQIKKVLDIRETEDCHNAFAVVVRPPTEQTNLLFSFQMTTEEPPKEGWLKMLCRHVANTICKADAVKLYLTRPGWRRRHGRSVTGLPMPRFAGPLPGRRYIRLLSFIKLTSWALQKRLLDARSCKESSSSSQCRKQCPISMARSASTYSLNGSVKHIVSVTVQRSNSVDGNSQSSRLRPLICPGSPTNHPSLGLEGQTPSSSLEKLNVHSLARSCPITVTATICDDLEDDQIDAENIPATQD
uniref:Epithelial cell transforming 2 n=1 Tax=Sphenodon punctatus TaxID=8508 RepID=A0A8D0H7N7_SPHPU